MTKAVVFTPSRRASAFIDELQTAGCQVTTLDFRQSEWREFDFEGADIAVYFPQFQHSSNHPLALRWAADDFAWLAKRNPHLSCFPDPALLPYYGDKYAQYRHLKAARLPAPKTFAVETAEQVATASKELGFPLVAKNRFGAGGDFVVLVEAEQSLHDLVLAANLSWPTRGSAALQARRIIRREFLRGIKPDRQGEYPFFSLPILAQQFCPHERDLKIVMCGHRIIEAHWRENRSSGQWKMNIDGGGAGIWSYVPEEAMKVARDLAASLGSKWLNIDLIPQGDAFLVSEFSPVWHHYRVREKEAFQYDESYNLELSWDESANIERLIVTSLIDA